MVLENTLPTLLDTLTASMKSALESTPYVESFENGISLLAVKNELLLSYLQNLVFFILLKLRDCDIETDEQIDEADMLEDAIVLKLVDLRVFLERGVRPLESRLSYQIQKVLHAADHAARLSALRNKAQAGRAVSLEVGENGDSDNAGSVFGDTGAPDVKDLQYRPNPSSFIKLSSSKSASPAKEKADRIYRPPRITATSMRPTSTREKASQKPIKSATLDEFVNTELSSTPFAEPSVGSTIMNGGRRSMSDREKQNEIEKREYEEKNYVRLPKESKKDKSKRVGRRALAYGGEEWRGLDEGIDRIERLTRRKSGEGQAVLENSRKRPPSEALQHDRVELGQGFQKKLKTLDVRRRDRRR